MKWMVNKSMTYKKLIENILTIEGTRVFFKQTKEGMVLIFWNGPSPIAHVFVNSYEYSLEYPMLYEMDLYDILKIDAWLYGFVNTEIEDREL